MQYKNIYMLQMKTYCESSGIIHAVVMSMKYFKQNKYFQYIQESKTFYGPTGV